MKKFIPLVIFIIVLVFLYVGLGKDTKKLPSPFIDKPFPNLTMIDYHTGEPDLIRNKFTKGWTLVNFWASWCTTCRIEHPVLMQIKQRGEVKMFGINYKDEKKDADAFLNHDGNPFHSIARDKSGAIGLNLGVYAMPESFLVDGEGIIRHKYLGEMTMDIWREQFLPFIQ